MLKLTKNKGDKNMSKLTKNNEISYFKILDEFLNSIPNTTKNIPIIKNVIFNNPATIIYWQDGTKTIVKVMKSDTFNEEYGVAMCYMKKIFGSSTKFRKIVEKYTKKEDKK
jgi:hypothetical protein